MDEYERKFQAALDEMKAAGIGRGNAYPPGLRLLRGVGLKPRPAYYVPFIKVALPHAIFSGVVWGLMMWFWWGRRGQWSPLSDIAIFALLAGALSGLFMAIWVARTKKRHKLSDWQSL
jgi:membrane associated rhomboid family serine protease